MVVEVDGSKAMCVEETWVVRIEMNRVRLKSGLDRMEPSLSDTESLECATSPWRMGVSPRRASTLRAERRSRER